MVYGAGAEKAAVLNQCSGERLASATSAPFVTFGYCVPKPYWLIVLGAVSRTGSPLENLMIVDICQPPMNVSANRLMCPANRLPLPTGTEYTSAVTMLCGKSCAASARSI